MNTVANIKTAILAGQPFYNGIKLPSPQTTGTMTQQSAYAQMKAQEIYDNNFK